MTRRWIFVLAVLAMLVAAGAFAAQQKKEPPLRTVLGHVTDKQDNPVPAGVVYLRNLRSQVVRTYNSDDEGRYRFSGLDPNVDYEIHAEKEAMASAKRTISSFDSRKEITINLKLDKKKS